MTTIVFPGQGSQFVGMTRDFYENFQLAKETFNLVESVTEIKIKDIIFDNVDNLLNVTKYTQLAIFCASISIFKVLNNEINIDELNINFVLGHSLGEYTALTAANSLQIHDCAKLLKIRGELMHNSYEPNLSGMVAVIGLNCLDVEKILIDNNLNLEIANDNSPKQIVISGTINNLKTSKNIFLDKGAKKYIFLNVSAAFHSKIMLDAENDMNNYINEVNFENSIFPIISNYSATSSQNKDVIIKNLSSQMSNRVRWVESINFLEQMKENKIIEIGPGRILTSLIKRISNHFSIFNLENISDIDRIKNEF